ncbi:MAG: N-acetylmuramoyl-L-alanine amidase family protein [Actinomycetota bacterium]
MGKLDVAAAAAAVVAGAVGLWIGQASSLAPEPAPSPNSSPEASPTPSPNVALPLAGRVFVLDPGHNAGNAEAVAEINALVPDGRGRMKACNTVGTITNDGYPEYAFNWDVADRTRAHLEDLGAVVELTRGPDGVGPCVDARGQAGADATALVSIHANGSESPVVAGFFTIIVATPLNNAQGAPSEELAAAMRASLEEEGFPPSNMVPDALQRRDDLGTLNFAQVPAVLLELAEFRNPAEAVAVQEPTVRESYAVAIADALVALYGE